MSSTTPRKYRDAFVARVRQARTDAGYTQRAVAMLLGLDASTYNNYERGRGNEPPTLMPLHLIERFCVLCQVSIDWLVTGTETRRRRRPPRPKKQKQQLNLFGANQKRAWDPTSIEGQQLVALHRLLTARLVTLARLSVSTGRTAPAGLSFLGTTMPSGS